MGKIYEHTVWQNILNMYMYENKQKYEYTAITEIIESIIKCVCEQCGDALAQKISNIKNIVNI